MFMINPGERGSMELRGTTTEMKQTTRQLQDLLNVKYLSFIFLYKQGVYRWPLVFWMEMKQ